MTANKPRDTTVTDERLEHNAGLRLAEASNLMLRGIERLKALESVVAGPDAKRVKRDLQAVCRDMTWARLNIIEGCQDTGFWVTRGFLERVCKQPQEPKRSKWRRVLDVLRE